MIILLQIHQSSTFCWPSGGWNDVFALLTSQTIPSYQARSPLLPSLQPPPLPCCHGYTFSSLEMRNGRWKGEWENERGESEGKTGRQRWWGRSEGRIEAQSAVWQEVLEKKQKGSKHPRGYSSMFSHFVTTNPHRVLSVPLSSVKTYIYPSQIRTELKANLLWELFLDMFWSAGFTSSLHSPC